MERPEPAFQTPDSGALHLRGEAGRLLAHLEMHLVRQPDDLTGHTRRVMIAWRLGGGRRPGFQFGLFLIGYGCARIVGELFRQPDPQIGFLWGGITMGMVLSLPMVMLGAALAGRALRRPAADA